MNKVFRDLIFALSGVLLILWIFMMLSAAPTKSDDPPAHSLEPSDNVAIAAETPEPTPQPTPEPIESVPPSYNPAIPLPVSLQQSITEACEENGVDLPIALAIIEKESGFDPTADNGQCYGLMQLNRQYFPPGLSDAENIWVGVEYLGQLFARYGSAEAALTAYNAGHDTGNRTYANSVLAGAEKWSDLLGSS